VVCRVLFPVSPLDDLGTFSYWLLPYLCLMPCNRERYYCTLIELFALLSPSFFLSSFAAAPEPLAAELEAYGTYTDAKIS